MSIIISNLLCSFLLLPFVNGFLNPPQHHTIFPAHVSTLPYTSCQNLSSNTKTKLQVAPMDDLIKDAFEWNANLGAPAALVAGAVIATFSDKREELSPTPSDGKWNRILKNTCRGLLLSSFFLQVMCIFVTTVTGTMLLSQGSGSTIKIANASYQSALALMNKNYEFEYLTARITFIQGLLHWLAAVGVENLIPREGDTQKTKMVNKFFASTLVTLVLFMLAFYNSHMTFYNNYAHMLTRYINVLWKRLIWRRPIRPMGILSLLSIGVNTYYLIETLRSDLKERKK